MTTDEPAGRRSPGLTIGELLGRQPSVVVEGDQQRPTLVRRNELLVARADLDRFRSAMDSTYVDGVDDVTDSVVRVRLRPTAGVNSSELSAELSARTSGAVAVTPNSLMYACSIVGNSSQPIPDNSDDSVAGDKFDRRGEWWGGRPVHDGEPMSAQGGPPGTDGEWWGGPVDRPVPVAAFRPTTALGASNTPGAAVALLDTGITPHPWWADAAWLADVAADDFEDLDRYPGDNRLDREAGHGTFVAGVVLQGAPRTTFVIERVLRSDGLCDEAELLTVLQQLALRTGPGRADVLNLSFGGYTHDDQPSPHVAAAVAALMPRTVVVAAAGNHGSDRPFWPAALPNVTAVGALTADGSRIARFSNYGDWVDTYRVGVRLQSAFVSYPTSPSASTAAGGDGATGTDPVFRGYAQWSGTSFAAPVVTAEIATVVTEQGLSPVGAAQYVRSSSPPAPPRQALEDAFSVASVRTTNEPG